MHGRTKRAVAPGLLIALAACTTTARPDPEREYVQLPVAVAVGCVKDRPAPPVPLREQHPDVDPATMPPGALARAVEAQGGERLNYENRLEAATSECKEGN